MAAKIDIIELNIYHFVHPKKKKNFFEKNFLIYYSLQFV
jgi:hypothetical protein